MNETVKKRWVAALRSDEYWQCRGALVHRGDEDPDSLDPDDPQYPWYSDGLVRVCAVGVLHEVADEADWDPADPLITATIRWNDDAGFEFPQIAGLIERWESDGTEATGQ